MENKITPYLIAGMLGSSLTNNGHNKAEKQIKTIKRNTKAIKDRKAKNKIAMHSRRKNRQPK